MSTLSASEKRLQKEVRLVAALRLIFDQLAKSHPTPTIDQVAVTTSGGTPSRSVLEYFGGDIPWIKSGDLTDGHIRNVEETITEQGLTNSSAKIFPKGSVVIALYGATVGKTGILTFPAASNQAVCSVTPRSADLRNDYLFWFLRYKREHFLDHSFGGAQPNISQKVLRETSIPLPSPEVQKQLATFFEAVINLQDGRTQRLPTIPESFGKVRKIVEWIDAVATRAEEAESNADSAISRLDNLLMSVFREISEDVPERLLEDVAPLTRRPTEVNPAAEYPGISARSFGRGTFHNPPLLGSEITWQKPFEVKAGDILVSNIKAWEGAIAVVSPEDDGRFGSHRYLTFAPKAGVATPQYVCFYLLSPKGLFHVGEASPGSADRNRTTGSKAMQKIPVPVPTYDKQLWFDQLYEKVDEAKRHIANSRKEREALLPSVLNQVFGGEVQNG